MEIPWPVFQTAKSMYRHVQGSSPQEFHTTEFYAIENYVMIRCLQSFFPCS